MERTFPKKPGHARWNLCISHAKRKTLNKLIYDAEARGERMAVKYADELVAEIFVGCKLVGNTTGKQVVNGAFYECIGFSVDRVQLKDLDARRDLTPADVPGMPGNAAEFSVAPTSPIYVGRALAALLG